LLCEFKGLHCVESLHSLSVLQFSFFIFIQAVENPTHQEIRDVLSSAGMKVGVENKLYSRERSKELLYRGRIRVQLKSDDGTPLNPDFPSRKLNFLIGVKGIKGKAIPVTGGGGP
jgi:signal recognition particle subunit SEC65